MEPHRSGPDVAAQMMLVTAVVLVVAFLALGGLLARVQEAGSATARIQDNTLREEALQVGKVVDALVDGLLENETTLPADADSEAFRAQLNRTLAHLALLEQERGYRIRTTFVCDGPLLMRVQVTLSDPTTQIVLESSTSLARAACN